MEDAQQENQVEDAPSNKAVAAFVLGLVSLLTIYACPILPVLAIVLGAGEKEGLGRAGMILGWIGVAVYAMAAVVGILFWIVGGSLLAFDL